MGLYPIHLELGGKQALVVGAGAVGVAKARGLLDAGARVRVVATEVSPEMEALASEMLAIERRRFAPEDLDGAAVAIAATDDAALQEEVFVEARRRGVVVAVVDDPRRSDFIAPAVLRRGELVVTVSTSGAAPALAARLRDALGAVIGENYGLVLDELKAMRAVLRDRYPDFEERRRAWYRLLDLEVLPRLARGENPRLEAALAELEDERRRAAEEVAP